MYELKNYRGVICHDNEEWCKIGRGIDLSFQNWHEDFDESWPEHLKISKISTFMGCLWPKYIMFDLKNYREVMFDSTEYWCKIWRKTDFCFQKWQKEFWTFSPEHFKVSKLGLWWDSFVQSWKYMSLRFTGELCVMRMKSDAKLKRNWLLSSKLTWGIWQILIQALKNHKNFHFNGLPAFDQSIYCLS